MPRRSILDLEANAQTNIERLKRANLATAARIIGKLQKQLDDKARTQAVAGNTYLRNSPIERSEVVIKDYKICTLPITATKLDSDGYPTAKAELLQDLVAELQEERQARLDELDYYKHRDELWKEVGEDADLFGSLLLVTSQARNRVLRQIPDIPTDIVIPPRQCKSCHNWFFTTYGNTRLKYCSGTCRTAATCKVITDYVARRANLRKKSHSAVCRNCGAELMSVQRRTKSYCSGRCRVAALRKRKA
jgi:hypothetical protein